jgi:hypothetical protein
MDGRIGRAGAVFAAGDGVGLRDVWRTILQSAYDVGLEVPGDAPHPEGIDDVVEHPQGSAN